MEGTCANLRERFIRWTALTSFQTWETGQNYFILFLFKYMANNLGAGQGFSPELWSARVQILRKNNLVAGAICNTEERSTLTYGTRVHRPIRSQVFAQPYTKGTQATTQDISSSDEYLDITQANIIPIYLDDIDRIQNTYKTTMLVN